MSVTKRFYLQNSAAPYSPATYKGAWDSSASIVDMRLGDFPFGAAATKGVAETNATNNYDVMLARFVSAALGINYTFTASDTVQWVIGVKESNAAQNAHIHVHIYVTVGDSDDVRGTLLNDYIGADEWTTTATGEGFAATALAGTVAAQAGDRIVVEIGYQAQNTVTTSYTGTINYGNRGTTDLTDGNTSVTTRPGWVEFVTATMCFAEAVKATGTWTCPTGIGQVTVEGWGGGGAGGGGYYEAYKLGAGGGGGGYSKTTGITVTPSTGYSVTVGAGGTGVSEAAGNPGGDSIFNNGSSDVMVAKGGGGGGTATAPGNANGGTGGQASAGTGDTKYNGGTGGNAVGVSMQNGGGGGGAGDTANGSNGTSGTPGSGGAGGTYGGGAGGNAGSGTSAVAGVTLGGGGGGALYMTGATAGAAGANGIVIITPTGLASATSIKKVSSVAYASIKKISGVAIASVKKVAGLA